MRILANIFGNSPFRLLQTHMDEVSKCVELLPEAFNLFKERRMEELEALVKQISKKEHYADLTKNDIRNHLPTSLFLPIDRTTLLEILTLQDAIADKAEDLAILFTFKSLEEGSEIWEPMQAFLDKNIECFHTVHKIINELDELLEFSFGGIEAEKVRDLVSQAAFQEHEADLLQRQILKTLFSGENQRSYTQFALWQQILKEMALISDISEKLANRLRMNLELK